MRLAAAIVGALTLLATILGASASNGWSRYTDPTLGWTIDYPAGVTVDPNYVNSAMGPGKEIKGVAFRVPESFVQGTNLHDDTALSIEMLPGRTCQPSQFVDPAQDVHTLHADGRTYIAADSQDAGAGNRYETQIFVVAHSCFAVRYFIHSSAIENYDPATVKAFDEKKLLRLFNRMRATLMLTK